MFAGKSLRRKDIGEISYKHDKEIILLLFIQAICKSTLTSFFRQS